MGFCGTLWRTKKTYERLKISHGSMRNSLKHKTVVERNKTWHGMIKDEAQESLKKIKEARDAKTRADAKELEAKEKKKRDDMNLLCFQRALLEDSLKQNEERQGDGSVSVEGGVDHEVEEFRIEAV